MVVLGEADHRFDGRAPPSPLPLGEGLLFASGPGNVNLRRPFVVVLPIALLDPDLHTADPLGLLDASRQGVSVVGISCNLLLLPS